LQKSLARVPIQNLSALQTIANPASQRHARKKQFWTAIPLLPFLPASLLRQGASVPKNPNITFPTLLFTES
jgi:hypothetical protein